MYIIAIFTALLLAQVGAVPNVTLPWGTWLAEDNGTYWHIPNVRFGIDTQLTRFQAPQIPPNISNPHQVMDSTYGPACIQVDILPPEAGSSIPRPLGVTSEDCLFLDVYIPKTVNTNLATTPVVVWFYGGAYVFGSKGGDLGDNVLGPFYTGQGLIEAVGNWTTGDVIFVAGNYRLGAFGWLAGPTMQAFGQPNIGIFDQSAILAWVQKYIGQVGGDSTHISLWSESAGASSIMHHLIQQDGQPLPFQTALLQSPAYEWQWDNSTDGALEQIFNEFAANAGCPSGAGFATFKCLQSATLAALNSSNTNVYNAYRAKGLFPYGPARDNMTFPNLAPLALQKGQVKPLQKLVVSHVFNESGTFTPQHTTTDTQYNTFVSDFTSLPVTDPIVQSIISQYPSGKYKNQLERLQTTIRDVSFTCNTRYLFNAYAQVSSPAIPVYMMQYSVGARLEPEKLDIARHAADLVPTFWYPELDLTAVIQQLNPKLKPSEVNDIVKQVNITAINYQQYLAFYATQWDPSLAISFGANARWNPATLTRDQKSVTNVLNFFESSSATTNTYTDDQNTWDICSFWLQTAEKLQNGVPITNTVAGDGYHNGDDSDGLWVQDGFHPELR